MDQFDICPVTYRAADIERLARRRSKALIQ
jgi:hypothetical protein